jgi:fatty-acyl-CoA synthase
MQDVPLLISRILEHGRTVHGQSTVTTWTGEGAPQRRTFAEIGARAAQLAHALRDDLGVTDQSVLGTLMCNSASKTLTA